MHAKMSAAVLALVLFAVPAGAQTYVLDKAIKAAAGGYHVVQLKADGTVDAWMAKSMPEYPADYGQTMVPAGLRGVIDVAAGCYFSAALKSDGTVTAWGAFSYSVDPPGDSEFSHAVAISAGCEHLLVLKSDGNVETWPRYAAGDPMAVPADLSGQVVAVAAGGSYNLALKADGSIRTWGSFDKAPDGKFIGISADPTATWSDTPMALRANGTVVTWNADRVTEVALPRPAIAIEYPLAILDDGTAVKVAGASATAVPGKAGIVGIATGGSDYDISVFIQGVPTVPVAWGAALAGAPTDFPSFKALAAGDGHVVALRPDGTVAAWGDNGQNQTAVPAGLAGVKAVAAGCAHSLALKSDGTVVAWGSTTDGGSTVPAWLSGFPIRAIAAGCSYSLALDAHGHVHGWGRNTDGQIPTPTTEVVAAIAAGGNASLGLRANGTLAAWGKYDTIPTATHVKAVSHRAALTSDGRVEEWDVSVWVPDGLTGVRAISSSPGSVAALLDDGAVRNWNGYDPGTPPAGMGAASAVAAGTSSYVALTRPGLINIEITAQHEALAFSVDGESYEGSASFSWVPGSTHTISAPDSQTLPGGATFSSPSWSDGLAATHAVSPTEPTTYTLTYGSGCDAVGVFVDVWPYAAGIRYSVDGVETTDFQHYYFCPGTEHTFSTVSPQGAYVFKTWGNSSGTFTYTTPSFTWTVPEDPPFEIDVSFEKDTNPRTVTVNTNPPGLAFSVNGTSYTGSVALATSLGDVLTLQTVSDQSLDGKAYSFEGWSDNVAAVSRNVTVGGDTGYTALFKRKTAAVIVSSWAGTAGVNVPVTVDAADYPEIHQFVWDEGTSHVLSVTSPVVGSDGLRYVFTGWSSTQPTTIMLPATESITITPVSWRNYVANFERERSKVTLATSPAGLRLTVDYSEVTAPSSFDWLVGSAHLVAADSPQGTSGTRHVFQSWSDGKALSHQVLAPSGGATLTATYKTEHLLTTTVDPPGAGAVSPSPASADGYYDAGSVVGLTAVANAHYVFVGWNGDAVGAANPTSVTMSAPRSVTANFHATTPTTTTVDAATGQYSDAVTLKASVTPGSCAGAVSFTIDGAAPSAFTVYSAGAATNTGPITLPAGTHTIRAVYTPGAGSYCEPSEGTRTLTLAKEDATILPDTGNPMNVTVANAGGVAGPLAFAFTVTEEADGSPGDISKAGATVQLVPMAGSTTVTCTASAVTAAGRLTATCSNVPVNVYDVRVTLTGDYYAGSSESVLAVADPSLGGVSGAGLLRVNGVPTQFALSVKYGKNGQPQGSLLVIQRGKADNTLKGTVITSCSIVGTTAIVLGKGPLNGVGNYSFKATGIVGDKPLTPAQFGLEVRNGITPVAGLTFPPLALEGGGIQVVKQK